MDFIYRTAIQIINNVKGLSQIAHDWMQSNTCKTYNFYF